MPRHSPSRGWNAYDHDAALSQFTDDAVFTSPVAAQLLPATGGKLNGEDRIRAYWEVGVEIASNLHFVVGADLDLFAVNFRNHVGNLLCEVLICATASSAGATAHAGRPPSLRPAGPSRDFGLVVLGANLDDVGAASGDGWPVVAIRRLRKK